MRMRVAPFLALGMLGLAGQADAWLIGKPPASAYTGPGDYASFTAWYGVRAYSAAVAATGTQPAMDLRRVSDNATCTALIGTDGNLDLTVGTPCNGGTETVTAWIGGSSARASKVYDQTGNNACAGSCDVSQATASLQANLLLTGCGGAGVRPCLEFVGGTTAKNYFSATNFSPGGAAVSLSGAGGKVVGNGGAAQFRAGPNNQQEYGSVANKWKALGTEVSATDGVWHVMNAAMVDGPGTSVINLDGVDTTSTGDTVSTTVGTSRLGGTGGFASGSTNQTGEGGFEDSNQWSAGVRTSLCNNMRLYWGTGGSC